MLTAGLLKGKRILVTGGGTGLGREMASRFASLGADLYLCGRRPDVVERTAREIAELSGVRVCARSLDIRQAAEVDEYIASIWADGGPLDGLVNNAAGNFISRTEDLSHRGFDAVANIVMHGTFYVTHSVGKRWIEEARRRLDSGLEPPIRSVLSILVTWITNGGPFVVPSAMAKSAIANMTKSLAVEWGHYGIRLNAIAPGEFPTEGMNARLSPGQETTGREQENPMRRVGRLSELQNLAAFLMADGVDWLTGQVVTIDGGNSLATGGNFYPYRSYNDEDWARIRESIRAQDGKDNTTRVVSPATATATATADAPQSRSAARVPSRNEQLKIRAELDELNTEFAHRVDHGDTERVADLFTEAGVYALFGGARSVGRDAIRATYAARAAHGIRTARHVFSNLHLLYDSTERIRGTTIMTLYAEDGPPPHPAEVLAVCDVDDAYERCDDGRWRYASRTITGLFTDGGGRKAVLPLGAST